MKINKCLQKNRRKQRRFYKEKTKKILYYQKISKTQISETEMIFIFLE